MNGYSIFGIIIYILVLRALFLNLGKTVPILEIILAIAGLQWIIAPLIEYYIPQNHYKYHMYVDEATYMGIVIPYYLTFVVFTLIGKTKKGVNVDNIKDFIRDKPFLGPSLIIVGVISNFVMPWTPPSLSFIVYLLALLTIPGIGLVGLQDPPQKYKYAWMSLPILISSIHAIRSAMFHEVLLLGVFVLILIILGQKIKLLPTLGFLVLSFFMITTLQSIKAAYRNILWQSQFSGSRVELFIDLISQSSEEDKEEEEGISARFNQGWIISKIIDEQQYTNFKHNTVLSSLESILLPRFLFPNKKTARSTEMFMELTGLSLTKNTSMGPSLLGEFYANFGFLGGMIMLGFWGFIMRIVYNKIVSLQDQYPLLPIWIPVLFYQLIKAETMFLKVGNHLFKSIILLVIIHIIFTEKFKLQDATEDKFRLKQ